MDTRVCISPKRTHPLPRIGDRYGLLTIITLEIGRSSIQMMVEVWSDDPLSSEWRKVTEAVFVFVAIDGSGRTRSVPRR